MPCIFETAWIDISRQTESALSPRFFRLPLLHFIKAELFGQGHPVNSISRLTLASLTNLIHTISSINLTNIYPVPRLSRSIHRRIDPSERHR